MEGDLLHLFIGSLTALFVAIGGAIPVVLKLWWRDNNTDKRVDVLWTAHVHRGMAEAKYLNMVEEVPTGPPTELGDDMTLLLRPDVRQAYMPIAPALRAVRARMPNATPGQFAEEVERLYGSWLAKHICAVLGISNFACLAMAQVVADKQYAIKAEGEALTKLIKETKDVTKAERENPNVEECDT